MGNPIGIFSERLAYHVLRARKELHWSQETLAHEAGLHATEIQAIEGAKKDIRLSTLQALCRALKKTPGRLLRPTPSERKRAS